MIRKPMILKVQHVEITIPKGAEKEARKFYCEVLGLREIPKPEILQPRGGFWVQVGTFQIHIGTEDNPDRAKSKTHVAYEVENLDNWREILENNGVKIVESIEIPYFHRFEFRDPFGNRVEFLEKVL